MPLAESDTKSYIEQALAAGAGMVERANARKQAAQTATPMGVVNINGSKIPLPPKPTAAGPASKKGQAAVLAAQKYMGTPYLWGGDDFSGIDCSGLVQAAYREAGVNLPRVSRDQAKQGHAVSRDDMQPGDVLAYGVNGIHHVTMYVGNGQMIEAPHKGAQVRTVPVRDSDLVSVRRIFD
jgi:cell wall-associated NlpC family hydrolase